MAYRVEKGTEDLIIYGWEQGISSSPNKGIAAVKNANISTESGEIMCNYPRALQTVPPFTGGIIARASSTEVDLIDIFTHLFVIGDVIVVTGSTMSGLADGNYYIKTVVSGFIGSQKVTLTATYQGATISGIGTGLGALASYDMATPVASATEKYYDGTNIQYRYYILASNTTIGNVWVYDTGGITPNIWTPVQVQGNYNFTDATGVAVLNGYLMMFQFNTDVWVKETALLAPDWAVMGITFNTNNLSSLYPRFCLVGHSGTLNVTDGNYIATFSPNSSSGPGVANVFAYGTYTFSTYTLTLTNQIDGSFPIIGQQLTFTSSGTPPTGLSPNTVYYVTDGTNSVYDLDSGTFSVSATVGGGAISLSGGAGAQYFNSFNPSVASTFIFDAQACTINSGTPVETAISLAELGNSLIIGTTSNTLYQWDEISPTWTNFIPLAESNSTFLLTVNNIVLIFAGTKGNIYVTSGSAASGALTVPDYLAGIPGNPTSYIEPYFVWGQAIFIRGRVFFSIQDQTSTKAGNCGGIYSFVPSFYNAVTGEDAGIALRMENENSYATFNGLANVLLASQNQVANGPQYWSAWTSSLSAPSYGIDFSGTFPTVPAVLETDLIPTGNILGDQKRKFDNLEYKLGSPLLTGESVAINYRVSGTSAWETAGLVQLDPYLLAGYISPHSVSQGQLIQLQVILIPNGTSTFSGVRLSELRIR